MASDVHHPPFIGPDHQLPAASAKPRGHGRWILGAFLIGALAVGVFVAARRHASSTRSIAPPPAKVAVTTTAARTGDIGVYLEAIGTVTPVHTASITSQVTGLVVAVHFREGQRVAEGDPLVDIDSRQYRASLLQAQGVLERDQNLLAEAKMDLERYQNAWARNAIARQQVDDQQKVVLQNMGTVKNDRGTVAYDQLQVDFSHIKAPFAGRVGLRLVDPGNLVQASGNVVLAVVAQIEPITVVFTIPQDDLGPVQARLAQGAHLAVDAFGRSAAKKLATGELITIDNQIDTTTGTVKARAVFDNEDDALFPNQFVNARLLVDTHRAVTLAASASVQQNGNSSYVYVIQDGVAHLRNVTPGITDDGVTQLTGVNPGDLLATSSFDRLRDGAPVVVSAAPAAASPTGSAAP